MTPITSWTRSSPTPASSSGWRCTCSTARIFYWKRTTVSALTQCDPSSLVAEMGHREPCTVTGPDAAVIEEIVGAGAGRECAGDRIARHVGDHVKQREYPFGIGEHAESVGND